MEQVIKVIIDIRGWGTSDFIFPETGRLALCQDEVRELWHIPEGIKELEVVLSDVKMENSYKVRLPTKPPSFTQQVQIRRKGRFHIRGIYYETYERLRNFLNKSGKKAAYVKIRY